MNALIVQAVEAFIGGTEPPEKRLDQMREEMLKLADGLLGFGGRLEDG